jgi:hypothetical protein
LALDFSVPTPSFLKGEGFFLEVADATWLGAVYKFTQPFQLVDTGH